MSHIDPVFGEVAYAYGWTKPIEVTLWGKSYRIDCVASAYKGQEIVEEQRKRYRFFLEHRADTEQKIAGLLQRYYESRVNPDGADASRLPLLVKPTELVFQRDGSCAMLFDCEWDADNGIAVCLFPEEKVGPQDLFI